MVVGQSKWINTIVASPSVASHISSWLVRTSLEVASDHHLIQTTLDLDPHGYRVWHVLGWTRTDWQAFNQVLQGMLGLLPKDPVDLETALVQYGHNLKTLIWITIEIVTPKKWVCQYSWSWWNAGLMAYRACMSHWRCVWWELGEN